MNKNSTTIPLPDLVTNHCIECRDARNLMKMRDNSIHCVVTSPPYPMITMWDELFAGLDTEIKYLLDINKGSGAFEYMHMELEKTWRELDRVLVPGGFVCINIGDAVRSMGGTFRLYPNHSRVEMAFHTMGYDILPRIVWQKTTNAPNKFMGSGMLPAGAYVTLEHEYILIFRKPGKRDFSGIAEKLRRRESAVFWEERNRWFSDIWRLPGAMQKLGSGDKQLRARSAAFPYEIASRLIQMYSLIGDTVFDPFTGTGTTQQAALACGRNSLGYELDELLASHARDILLGALSTAQSYADDRIKRHGEFVDEHEKAGKEMKYTSTRYGFPVKTQQEQDCIVPRAVKIEDTGVGIKGWYER